jgi:hypothetical protein
VETSILLRGIQRDGRVGLKTTIASVAYCTSGSGFGSIAKDSNWFVARLRFELAVCRKSRARPTHDDNRQGAPIQDQRNRGTFAPLIPVPAGAVHRRPVLSINVKSLRSLISRSSSLPARRATRFARYRRSDTRFQCLFYFCDQTSRLLSQPGAGSGLCQIYVQV